MNQSEAILEYLKEGNKITPLDALDRFGCFRLASRISDLKKQGYNIKMEMISRGEKSYAEYSLSEVAIKSTPATFFKTQSDMFGQVFSTNHFINDLRRIGE